MADQTGDHKMARPEDADEPVKLSKSEASTQEEGSGLNQVPSDFFDDFEPTPYVKKHYNLTPELANTANLYPDNDLGIYKDDRDIDTAHVLAADHPLLERFQRSLKDQLTKRIYLLRQDVAELEEGCKMKTADKEMVGLEAYETQQTSNKQQESIEQCLKELEMVVCAREEVEYQLEQANDDYQYEKSVLVDTEKEEIQVRNELESVDVLLSHMTKWEEEIETELMVNQRILDNTERAKARLHEQKKEQDTIIYNLMTEVWKLESELETMLMQLRVKEEDRERLAEAVALANIDVDANQSEHRCLLHGWQSVLFTITQRDKYCNGLQEEYRKYDDKLSSLNCELIHIKKEIHHEHLENERLMMLKDRLENDQKNTSRLLNRESDKHAQYMMVSSQYEKFIDENQRQKNAILAEIQSIKEQAVVLSREVEKKNNVKFQMEQEIVTHLQENAFNSDACRQMANVLKDVKEENRRMRINIARVEGIISNKHAEWQSRRLENNELTQVLRDLTRTMTEEDNDLMSVNREYANCEKDLSKLIAHYEVLKQKTAGDAAQKLEMWPQEVRIRTLEATIADLLERNKQSQSFWLREQAIVVDLSEKRQVQMKEMDLLKKQIRIMDQKNLRINDALEDLNSKEEKLNRNITALENKLYLCTSSLNKKRDSKNAIDMANNKVQSDLLNKLEESEFESLRLKAEILEIEEDKLVLSKELIERNREALAWEKRLMMILDARKQMHDSRSESGDISQMKSEIHRMNVRYMHLKKAQEKLIHDLDNCVYRRDSIVTLAEARTRGYKGGSQQWRVNFNKRRDDIKNKLAQIDHDFDTLDQKIQMKDNDVNEMMRQISTVKHEISKLLHAVNQLNQRIEKAKIDRQLNLDVLLFKQRKLKVYSELSRGREPFVYFKTQSAAHNAYVREREMNSKLRRIVEGIQVDMPHHVNVLTKMHNALVLPALTL